MPIKLIIQSINSILRNRKRSPIRKKRNSKSVTRRNNSFTRKSKSVTRKRKLFTRKSKSLRTGNKTKRRKSIKRTQSGGNMLTNFLNNIPFGESVNSSFHAIENGVSNTLKLFNGDQLTHSSSVTNQPALKQ